jgi:hypothetical protein
MAKKSKPSVKEDAPVSVKEETTIVSGEDEARFNYVDLFNAAGILIAIIFIIGIILRYILHMV